MRSRGSVPMAASMSAKADIRASGFTFAFFIRYFYNNRNRKVNPAGSSSGCVHDPSRIAEVSRHGRPARGACI